MRIKQALNGTTLFVGGIVTALVVTGGGAVAYAANGGSITIGKVNTATRTTTLSSSGIPLRLQNRHGGPPLSVNSSRRVSRLNSDYLDGYSAADFASVESSTGYFRAAGTWQDVSGDGVPDTIGTVLTCPRGTSATGGGVIDLTAHGIPYVNAPTPDGKGWLIAILDDPANGDSPDAVQGFLLCFNARGPVGTGGPAFKSATTATRPFTAAEKRMLARGVAAKQ